MREFIRITLPYLKPYRSYAGLNILFNLLASLFSLFSLGLLIPFLGILFDTQQMVLEKPEWTLSATGVIDYFYYFISQVIMAKGKITALIYVSAFVLGAILCKNLSAYFANFFMAPLRNGMVRDIRNKLYRKSLDLHLGFFSEEKKGDIISRMTSDAQEFEWAAIASIEMLFRDPVLILLFFSSLLMISPQLTLMIIILLPISGLIIGRIAKSLKRSSTQARIHMGILLSYMEETLGGLRIIKAFTAEEKVEDRFAQENQVYTRIVNRVFRREYMASPLSEFLGVFTLIVVMYYGATIVLGPESRMAPEVFIGYIAIFSQVINPSKSLTAAYYRIQKGLAAIHRINEILGTESKVTDKSNALPVDTFNEAIRYEQVHFRYTENVVLSDVNLEIKKGQTIALVGQSGSGKSTLVDLLPRFYDVTSGRITIDGANITDLRIKNLRALMGNVNQESILFNDTIYNNIAFGVEETTPEEVEAAAKVANAHDFIMETPRGYQTNIGDRGSKLSGGQRQRISIARAILKNPPILILDEATSALDTESEKLVQDALINLMKNRTSIVIAHRLSTIKHADVIFVLDQGRIAEHGTHAQLIRKDGIYKKLHDLQQF